ncbi:hypothetical protein [Kitasatospora sp. GP82]|uniref:hypothetical protein n=1 Tax=Kitasatospora sp. GP82 TaxID=3035089 RepID=UPI00247530D7|nr:hypothetical protein [Kitasatospora sp. GP82]MDH6123641.1 hypothetical protein [Kitasatospora sp. GP82]
MIPEFDVQIQSNYDLSTLRVGLTAEDVSEGFTEHHQYECIGLPSWDDAEECLRAEAEVMDQAQKSAAPDGVEAILDDLMETDDVGYAEMTTYSFFGNDVGVAGLSVALGAARVATFYSCSSGLGKQHHSEYPMVGAVPDHPRAVLLAELIEQNGCGVGQELGRWYIYGRSIWDMHALAKAILTERDMFDSLPRPSWVKGLAELLEEMEME